MSEECAVNYMDGLIDEINNLQLELIELKQHLQNIEWNGLSNDNEMVFVCPVCGNYQHDGHTDTCWLYNAIKE